MNRDRIAAIIREHATEIRARGIERLGLFGSTARGDADAASDVDFVVDVAPGRTFSLIDLAGLRSLLSELVGREADVVVREDVRPDFRARIERETVRVL